MRETSNKIVSVIIVTFGAGDYLRLCLGSVMQQTLPGLEIIVVSNTPNQNFNNEFYKDYTGIKLYPNISNLFYCGALNKGIEMSQGDFILCLNDDVILDKRFIEEAVGGFALDNGIGMVSGKILRSNGKTIDSTGLFLSIWRTAKERGYGLKDKGQYEKEGYIFGVSGAVAFYRRDMLESIKLGEDYFDRDYHIFYEDLDSAWRANNFGWKAYYMPSAIAYHVRGATVRQGIGINMPFARRYLNNGLYLDLIKNRYLTIIKNERAIFFIIFLPFIFFYDVLSWGHILFCRPALISKFFPLLQNIKFAFKKRRQIKIKKIN
jgi:GT2 family glycosyltransferase